MFKRILVPLDGSEVSELALPYAEELAGAFRPEVQLVYVCDPAESHYRHMHDLYIEKMAEQMKQHIRTPRVGRGSRLPRFKPLILDGDPASRIIDYAEQNDVSLIIMVSHGRTGIKLWVLGSTALKVMQRASRPVLLIRSTTPSQKTGSGELLARILVPLDGSEAGEAALPYVRALAGKLTSTVTLLQVVTPGQYVHTVGGLNYVLFSEQQVDMMKEEARQYLETVAAKLAGTEAAVKCEVKTGNAAQEIVRFADEGNTDLVAVSSHGRSGVRRWTSGGVAHKVLHAGNTPLLLVKAPQA